MLIVLFLHISMRAQYLYLQFDDYNGILAILPLNFASNT